MLLLLGPPGAGKSVQAKLLDEAGLVQWLSVGKLLRNNLTGKNREIMHQGKLVNNDVVNDLVAATIESLPQQPRILIDGFPRRNSQAKWLSKYLEENKRELTGIIHLQITEEEAVRRLSTRGRMDDDETTVRERYKHYKEVAIPVIEYFVERGVTAHQINGFDSIEGIHRQIVSDLS